MGFFSFLKKKEEKPFPEFEPLKLDLGKPPVETLRPSPSAPLTPEVPPSFEHFIPEPSRIQPSMKPEITSRDIELLSAKLDTIKAMLENLSNRIEKLEQPKERIRW